MRPSMHRSVRQLAAIMFALSSVIAQVTIAVLGIPVIINEHPVCISPWALAYDAAAYSGMAIWLENPIDGKAQTRHEESATFADGNRVAFVINGTPADARQPLHAGDIISILPVAQLAVLCNHAGSNSRPAVADSTQSPASTQATTVRDVSMTNAVPWLKPMNAKSQDGQKRVVLTFDDGPSSTYTPEILDILKDEAVHAVFFVVGAQAEARPELLSRMTAEGHDIGNHTYSHLNPVSVSRAELIHEIMRTSEIVKQATGSPTVWFRPPGGSVSPDVIAAAEFTGHDIVLWNVDTQDWRVAKLANADQLVVAAIAETTIPGISIVLMHDGGGPRNATVSALRPIIRYLKDNGYIICSLSKLSKQAQNGLPAPVRS